MSGEYPYLVASLPHLKFGEKPPLSTAEFLAECGKWLAPGDMEGVRQAELFTAWQEFNTTLKKALAAAREGKKPADTIGEAQARRVMEAENPLLKEMAYERVRWDYLESESALSFFGVGAIIFYFLRLRILERLSGFNKDKGEKIFYDSCEVKI